jgi:L-alanine-DL-glutamate epimerase-like enolase superfamily enzyme
MPKLRITEIVVYRARIPLVAPFRIALGVISEAESLFVRVDTDAGVSGWGEASPVSQITGETQATSVAAAAELARLLLGKDPLDVESRVAEMVSWPQRRRASAFDMALYDVAGQRAGLPSTLCWEAQAAARDGSTIGLTTASHGRRPLVSSGSGSRRSR